MELERQDWLSEEDTTTLQEKQRRAPTSGVVETSKRCGAWTMDNVNRSLKARILSEPRPGVRGSMWHAYVAFHLALDAKKDGEQAAYEAAIRDGNEWMQQARLWDEMESK